MGLIRLRVRELAEEKGWTLKEVSERSGIPFPSLDTDVLRSKVEKFIEGFEGNQEEKKS